MSTVFGQNAPQSPIRQDRAQLRAIFDGIGDGVVISDLGGCIVEANCSACALFELPYETLIRQPIGSFASGAAPDSPAEVLTWLQTVPNGGAKTFEWFYDRKGGRAFWAQISLRRITLADRDIGLAVIRDVTEQKKQLALLIEQSGRDPSTGLPNRRDFEDTLQHEIARYERYGGYLCVAAGQILRGQDGGFAADSDSVLPALAQLLRGHLRKSDYMARTGRNSLALLIHDARPDSAARMLNRMRMTVENFAPAQGHGPVTLSFAVTGYRMADTSADLLARLDHTLLLAKDAGGIRVVAG